MPSPLQISLKVTGLDQAKADLQTFAQGGKRSFDELAAEAQRVSTSSLQTDRALSGVANRVRALSAEFDPAATASIRLRNSLTDIDRAVRANIITTGQAATLTAGLRAQHDNLSTSANRAATSTKQLEFAAKNLGFQLNDITTSLLSGASPFRVLAQQGGQVVQAFQQGGGVTSVLGLVGTTIKGWITPTTLAVAGIGTLAAGFGALLLRSSSNLEQLRQFNVALEGTGRASLTTAEDLQKVVKQLQDIGVSRDEATAAVTDIARNPRLNPAEASRIAQIGSNVGGALGVGAAAGIEKFTAALTGGVEGVLKLGFQINALTVDEATNIRTMARHGQEAQAFEIAIEKITGKLKPFQDTLSESKEATQSLSNAWRDLVNNLADTKAFQNVHDVLVNQIREIADLLSGKIGLSGTGIGKELGSINQSIYQGQGTFLSNALGPLGVTTTPAGRLPGDVAYAPIPPALSGTMRQGGAVGNVFSTTANASLANVDPDLVRAFEAALIETGMRAVITSTAGGGHAGGSQHYPWNTTTGLGEALDFNLLDAQGRPIPHAAAHQVGSSEYQSYLQFGDVFKRLSAGRGRSGMDFSQLDPGHVDFGLSSGAPGGARAMVPPDPDALSKARDAVKALSEAEAERTRIARAWGVEQQAQQAYWTEYHRALNENKGLLDDNAAAQLAEQRAQAAASGARERANIELQKSAQLEDMRIAGLGRMAKAFEESAAAGYRAQAFAEAEIEAKRTGADVTALAEQKLKAYAETAILAGQQQLSAARPQIAALEQLAEATRQGAAAAHEQEVRNQATAVTQDALTKAIASGIPAKIAEAEALHKAALAQAEYTDQQRQSILISQQINRRNDQIAVVQLATSMQGQAPEVIAAATERLKEQLRLRDLGASVSERDRQAALDSVDALAAANAQWAEAVRQQQRAEDGVRQIADTIENTLARSIEDAFSGQKVEDWGTRIKRMMASLLSSITSTLFLRPLTGTLLGALGFGGLASQYGSFGGIGGFGGGTSGGGFGIGTLANGASLFNSFGGGGTTFSSTSNLFDKIGLGGVGDFFRGGLGGIFGSTGKVGTITNAAGETSSLMGINPGSIFGNLTFGGALSSIGAGFGAGSLLNSLLGGNTLTGTIGSGLGSIAGTLLPSALGLSLGPIGGILGGALGGLLGLFGPKPSVFSSGGAVNLASGSLGSFASSGNAQNDATVRQIASSIGQFATAIQRTSGGTINPSAYIAPVASTEGIRLDYSLVNRGTGSIGVASAEEGIRLSQLAIARELEGVTDTVKKVIDTVSDPADLEAAIQFAAAYDKIAEATKSAFASIPGDLDQTGPFAAAKEQIAAVFDELTANAQKFGLSLDPVNTALAEASRRLTEDFNRSISDATLAIENPLQAQIQAIKRAGDAQVREAEAVGGDIVAANRLTAAQLNQLWQDQTASIASLRADLLVSGLTPARSVAAANDNFLAAAAAARGGDYSRIGEIAGLGSDVINRATATYGNAPQTATIRAGLISALDAVLASRSFAGGTDFTPPGAIIVGERGPELLYQSGGAAVVPRVGSVQRGDGAAELIAELRALRIELAALLNVGNRVAQAAAAETIKRLDAQIGAVTRAPALIEPPRRKVA